MIEALVLGCPVIHLEFNNRIDPIIYDLNDLNDIIFKASNSKDLNEKLDLIFNRKDEVREEIATYREEVIRRYFYKLDGDAAKRCLELFKEKLK